MVKTISHVTNLIDDIINAMTDPTDKQLLKSGWVTWGYLIAKLFHYTLPALW